MAIEISEQTYLLVINCTFGILGNLWHDRDGFNWVFALGSFTFSPISKLFSLLPPIERKSRYFRRPEISVKIFEIFSWKHNTVGTIENGVGNIGDFGTGWSWLGNHWFQHLGGTDNWLTNDIASANDHFLGKEDLNQFLSGRFGWSKADCVGKMDGRTFSAGISIPISPRATMIPSEAVITSSIFLTPSWFSILEMILMLAPSSPRASRTKYQRVRSHCNCYRGRSATCTYRP